MKPLNHLEIARLAEQVEKQFVAGRIQKIYMRGSHDLVFDVRCSGQNQWLLISLHPRFCRLHTLREKPEMPPAPSAFCMALRKHLGRGRIVRFESVSNERIIHLVVDSQERQFTLIAELFGASANAFLVGQDGTILDVLFPRRSAPRGLKIHATYNPPEKAKPREALDVRDFGPDAAAFLEEQAWRLFFEERRSRLESVIGRHKKRGAKYLTRLRSEREGLHNPEELRKNGELLSIHLNEVHRGMESLSVQDIYLEDAPERILPLDPKMDGPRNVEHYFRLARKTVRKLDDLRDRIARMEAAQNDLADLAAILSRAGTEEDLDRVQEQLVQSGLERKPTVGRKKGRIEPSGPKTFLSADGVKILVGRNAKQNEEVTFKRAKGNDYWLHVMGNSGSHVLVQMKKNESLKQETLLDAATLALLHSGLAKQGRGDVIYTRRKYVSRPKGARPGQVIYSQSKTIHVRIETKRVERLMKGS